jgi:glyoxylase-like metal-dependent hydrolase (beta-lactamase superfamily II)
LRISQIDFLTQITFLPRTFPVNCYLVEEEEGLTLIDAALPYSAKAILKVADAIGKPITNIILTHAHQDHVGALDSLHESLPGVPVHISLRDYRLMCGHKTLDSGEDQTPIKGGVPKRLTTRANVLLKEGDVIGSLVPIETPGHTPGSMSFLDRRTSALIAGDAFQTRGGIAVAGDIRPLFPFPALATWSKKTALSSAKKLINYGPDLLAVGHGDMLQNPITAMQQAVNNLEKKLKT